jgi:2-aminoadipate transaminase
MVVLNGSQEGLFIMAYMFLDQEDSVVVCEPTYPGAISAFAAFCPNFVSVPLDSNGLETNALERKLNEMKRNGKRMPKFIYTIPSGHNPGGVRLSEPRRKHLVRIAADFDILILEDDPYELIKLDDTPLLPTLQSLDQKGLVVRLDSFSKIFAPGLRIGYASGPADLIRKFVYFKQSSSLHTSMFIQEILLRFLRSIGFESFRDHIRNNCLLYRSNRDAMLEAVNKFLPGEVRYNVPREGMFIWFELPKECNSRRMIEHDAEELKVLLVPGDAFSTQGGLKNCMRASFSLVTPARIEEGVRRFSRMIERELRRR